MDKYYTTKSASQTQKLGELLAKEILKSSPKEKAVALALRGDLGGGKTTFLQGFARGMGIKEKVLSPTFVILKKFTIQQKGRSSILAYKYFYHIDCYRLKEEKDILGLGIKDILKNPENVVAIEWPEKIKKILPKALVKINFKFIDKNKREISF